MRHGAESPRPIIPDTCGLYGVVRLLILGSTPTLTTKIYIMKNALLTVLSTVLSVAITGIGLFLMVSFLLGDFKIIPFLIGLVGYFIALRPAINEWENTFKKIFKVDDK